MRSFTGWLRAFAATIAISLVATVVFAQAPVAGKDYVPITPPQPTESGNKIEVIEFFSYGCPHCATLEAPLNAWMKKKPADVEFKRVPVIFNESWAPYARLYYTLEAMSLVDKLHGEVFKAVHDQKLRLQDPKVMADWIGTKGVDKQKFMDTYNSFSVQSRSKMAPDIASRYKSPGDGRGGIPFTPAVVVDGRFLTAPSMAGETDRFFKVLDQLIMTSRKPGK